MLKLTEDDIARAQESAQQRPLTPAVLCIGLEDLPDEEQLSPQGTSAGSILTITGEDLTAVPPQFNPSTNLDSLEKQMFALVNQARAQQLPNWLGKRTLKWHTGLAAVARGHSTDMIKRQYINHTTPEGTSSAKRIEQHGIRYIASGENIGVVYGAASHSAQGIDEIHKAFMNQPFSLTNHRGNLLNPIWTDVGIGAAYDPSGTLVVTQSFICAAGK